MSFSSPGKFTPTATQIRCAQELMVARAFEDTIRPIVEGYQHAILAKHQFKRAVKWGEQVDPEGDVITDSKRVYLLNDADLQVYVAECQVAQEAHGLKVARPGNCPLLEAQSARIGAENVLLQAWKDDPDFSALADSGSQTVALRDRAIELTLNLLAPYVKGNANEMLADLGIHPPVTQAQANESSLEL